MNFGEGGVVEIFTKVLILEFFLYLSFSSLSNKQANKRTN